MEQQGILIFERRWTPWWAAPALLIPYTAFAWVLVRSLFLGELGVRAFLPPYLLCGYLLLAAAANIRTSRIDPTGVRVSNMPFPCWPASHMIREDVWTVYARQSLQVITDDGRTHRQISYWAGVENAQGRRIDLTGPFEDFERAHSDARAITEMLNWNPTGRRLEIGSSSSSNSADRTKRLVWLAAIVAATSVGIVWEVTS